MKSIFCISVRQLAPLKGETGKWYRISRFIAEKSLLDETYYWREAERLQDMRYSGMKQARAAAIAVSVKMRIPFLAGIRSNKVTRHLPESMRK